MSLFFKMHATHKSVAKDVENASMMKSATIAHIMDALNIP